MKFTVVFFLAIFITEPALAAKTEIGEIRNFGEYISNFWALASQIIFAVSVVALIAGGAALMFAGANETAARGAKSIISGSIVSSLLVVFSAVLQNWLADPAAAIEGVGRASDAVLVAQKTAATLLATVGIVATLALIFAGLKLIFAAGDLEKIRSAKRQLKFAILGIAISAAAFTILRFVISPFL